MGLSWSQEPDRSKPTSVLGMLVKMHRAGPGDCWGSASLKNARGQKIGRFKPIQQGDHPRKPCAVSHGSPALRAWPYRGPPGSPSSFLRTPRPRPQSGLHPESLGQASEFEVVAEGAPAAVSSPSRANGTPEGAGCLCSDMLGPGPSLLMLLASPR